MTLSFLFKRQQVRAYKPLNRYLASLNLKPRPMGKKKPSTPGEEYLLLPTPPSTWNIVDTHTHVASTFSNYRLRYKQGKHQTVYDLVRTMYEGRNVESIVDVWCEAPVEKQWKEFADSALNPEHRQTLWGGLEYWFVMGAYQF
jgi:TatD DNase family protein